MSIRIEVAPPSSHDATELAALHAGLIVDGFLTSLGGRFLRHLYLHLGSDPRCFVSRAISNDGHVGFAAMTTDLSGAYRRFVLRRGVPAALSAVPILVRPTGLRRVVETMRASRVGDDVVSSGPAPVLMNFCVEEGYQRLGVGRRLLACASVWLEQNGYDEFVAVTGAHQHKAVQFYRRLGAHEQGTMTLHEGQESVRFVVPTAALQHEGS